MSASVSDLPARARARTPAAPRSALRCLCAARSPALRAWPAAQPRTRALSTATWSRAASRTCSEARSPPPAATTRCCTACRGSPATSPAHHASGGRLRRITRHAFAPADPFDEKFGKALRELALREPRMLGKVVSSVERCRSRACRPRLPRAVYRQAVALARVVGGWPKACTGPARWRSPLQ